MSELTDFLTNIADAIRYAEDSTDIIAATEFYDRIVNLSRKKKLIATFDVAGTYTWTIPESVKRKGYLDGLVISNSKIRKGVGGGLCQMANMIHWLVLHTPLEVTELHHHSDALFPDEKRRVPFGTGTSICYKALDYRFKNVTNIPIQIRVWLDETMLYGEIRSIEPLKERYRNSKVYRIITDKETKQEIKKELILDNHSKVMYDYDLIPKEEVRMN